MSQNPVSVVDTASLPEGAPHCVLETPGTTGVFSRCSVDCAARWALSYALCLPCWLEDCAACQALSNTLRLANCASLSSVLSEARRPLSHCFLRLSLASLLSSDSSLWLILSSSFDLSRMWIYTRMCIVKDIKCTIHIDILTYSHIYILTYRQRSRFMALGGACSGLPQLIIPFLHCYGYTVMIFIRN